MPKPQPYELSVFLRGRHCECGCGRVADTVRGPIGWRGRGLPAERTRWRALAFRCAEAEHGEQAA
jgi:hypothetical protein